MSVVRPPRFAMTVLALAPAGIPPAFAISWALRDDAPSPSPSPSPSGARVSAAQGARPALRPVSPLPGLHAPPAKPSPARRRARAATVVAGAEPSADTGGGGQYAPEPQDT
ncbi:MAG: hypothetical protein QOD76_837, partial [Solirubrobacteraceae bacterium]|nr:hypothetical protein [Solirubrobacteraceae bacterium]